MRKRFIAYSKYNFNIVKIIVYIIFILIGFIITIKVLFKNFVKNNDTNRVNQMLAISSNNLVGNISLLDILNANLAKPESILSMSFSNVGSIEYQKLETKKEEKVVNTVNRDPLVYIYNTHQTEEYSAGYLSEYNITPTVYMASNILKKRLENYDINAIVEDENIVDVLRRNNWKYNESYYASMQWLKNAKERYPSLKYFIDLHRDSASGTVTIDDRKYAKMMFVVGMNHENYEKNEELVIKLNDYLNNHYKGLMRNIFYGKRSQYNQDFDPNTFLIEVGGPENTIDEVYNSVNALGEAISNVIGGV